MYLLHRLKDIDARQKVCLIDPSGKLFEATNDKTEIATPVKVKSVTSQSGSVFIIDENDKLWTFGSGRYGFLGHGNTNDYTTPTIIVSLQFLNFKQVSVAYGTYRVVCSTTDGRAFGWGLCKLIGLSDDEKSPVELTRDHRS